MARERRQGPRGRKENDAETVSLNWVPKTKLGKLVYAGKITTMSEALATRLPLKEPEIVDILLPEMQDEVLDVNMVQRMTDSGRRVRFAVTAVVGNGDGFVGMGRAKGKEVGPTIRNAIDRAKLNIIEVKRGCGSWECGCGGPHTFPFAVEGKCGSVRVNFKPAPRGVGLAIGDVAKKVVGMAGIKDAWGFAKGHTKTTVNYSFAAFDALKQGSRIKVRSTQAKNLNIISGPVNPVYLETSPEEINRRVEERRRKARELEEAGEEVADDDSPASKKESIDKRLKKKARKKEKRDDTSKSRPAPDEPEPGKTDEPEKPDKAEQPGGDTGEAAKAEPDQAEEKDTKSAGEPVPETPPAGSGKAEPGQAEEKDTKSAGEPAPETPPAGSGKTEDKKEGDAQ